MTALDTLDILRHYFSLRRRGDIPAITTLRLVRGDPPATLRRVRLPALSLPPPARARLLPVVDATGVAVERAGIPGLPVEGRHRILRNLRRVEEVEHVRP